MSILALVIIASLLALGFAAMNFVKVKKMDEGTDKMAEIASAIRIGANAFINYEYKILLIVTSCIFVALCILVNFYTALAFVIGAVMSASAGYVGMKIATYANVRVANEARVTKKLGSTLKVAFRGGSVMGLCVGGFALFGLFLVYIIFGIGLKMLEIENVVLVSNWLGVEFVPFTMVLSGYALGCSLIAMFNRVGGGIYTKAADMGADLVGKIEANIPEDDPRNPATIADNVGDNVGDVAGLGSDLLESYVGAITAAIILGFHLFLTSEYTGGTMTGGLITDNLLTKLFLFPVVFAAGGLIACVIGIASLLFSKNLSDNPHRELNRSTWLSSGLTIVFGFFVTYVLFKGEDLSGVGFAVGYASPWIAATFGVVAGIVIGLIAEYYTSYDYRPTRRIAEASQEGAALTITQGLGIGMKSCMAPLIVLGTAIAVSYYVSGMYGVAMAAAGMLSFVSAVVSVDTYGPISDNAGGIAEMSKLDHNVREITDKLDSVGNTTAAIGKGFAIGSAALAALSLMVSYLYSYNDPATELLLNLIDPLILVGVLCGAALPFLFSGMLIDAVANAARRMVDEVRRQFNEIPGILDGTANPDYKTCIEISSQGALREMKTPSMLAMIVPVVCGFLFGPAFVGGILIGSTVSAVMLAIFTGNAGGAWDNAKKYIETGALKGHKKGSPAHSAAVVGDTVGDPLKDTVGPSLDIFIKIMSVVSLVTISIFSKYNLVNLLKSLLSK